MWVVSKHEKIKENKKLKNSDELIFIYTDERNG